jgi:ribonuclease P protein component
MSGFPKEERLLRTQDFQRVFSCGHKVVTRKLVVLACPRETQEESPARLGLVISRKTMKRAVDRNLTKRRLRAIFREEKSRFPFLWDFVVVGRPGAKEGDLASLKKDFLYALASIRKGKP